MKAMQDALRLRKLYPDFLVGFDLVGQEDLGHPLLWFIDDFRIIYNQTQGDALGVSCHANRCGACDSLVVL